MARVTYGGRGWDSGGRWSGGVPSLRTTKSSFIGVGEVTRKKFAVFLAELA
jgi:hypothetical protein